jgi:CubicO group peptidase (beta-lactamase class C family)
MGHLGGVRQDAGDEEPVRVHCDETAEGLDRFASRPLLSEPGTQYRFSTYSWMLVSAVVEAASGDPFFGFMRRQVFEPLGMDDTSSDASTEATRGQATYYFPRFAADPRYGPQSPGREDFSCFSGASAFLSTPADLARFAMAIDSGRLLQPATVARLQTSQRLASGQETGYGLGWDLETIDLAGGPARLVGHDGDLRGGMVSSFWTFPDGLVVAVTSNTAFADTWSIALKIARAFSAQSGS